MFRKLTSMTGLLAVAAGLGIATGHGATILEGQDVISCEILPGGAGLVDIVEFASIGELPFGGGLAVPGEDDSLTIPPPSWVGYLVDVKAPGVEVTSFAISVSDFYFPETTQFDWGATFVAAGDWNAGVPLPNGESSTALGSYESFFNDGSVGVAFFYAFEGEGPLEPITSANDDDWIQFSYDARFFVPTATAFSETLVFGSSGGSGGGIIDGSTIPEPSVAFLGLAALGMMLRRRR